MNMDDLKSELLSLSGDSKQAAIDAITAILNNRKSSDNSNMPGGSAALPSEMEIDPNLLIPTSGNNQNSGIDNNDFDDPDDLLSKRKFHNTGNKKDTKSTNNNKQKTNNNSDKENNSDTSKASPQPQIGDRGDPNSEIQKAEDAYRKANEYKEESENKAAEAEEAGDIDKANEYKDLADKADKEADKAKKLIDSDTTDDKEKARLERIKKNLSDINTRKNIIGETERAVFTSRQLQYDRKQRREYNSERSDLLRFKESIDNFIKDATSSKREPSWKRPNKRYPAGSNIFLKGKARVENKNIPLLAVYYDQSGSWGADDIEIGNKAIAGLNKYVKQNKLQIKIFYFGDDVSGNAADVSGRGTSATQKILDHIERIHANNVVIMTDSDMDHQGEFTRKVTVDGGVWFLFRNGRSKKLMEYLRGRKLTQAFDI